jgi:hypothetical protein
MERKPQQQTLSIRISEALREFLERSKLVISHGRGEPVSTSDVAKILLESAKDDRLDFRLEAAELQRSPTEALAALRNKWEQRQPWSRAEWIFLAQYVQVACEELSENPALPGPDSFIVVLEAMMKVRALRGDRGAGLDRYYLGNLGIPETAVFNDRQFDPDLVPKVVADLIQEQRRPAAAKKPVFVGRNLYVALRDEELDDLVALNRALEPFVERLFRLAARGHWIREHQPVRVRREGPTYTTPSVQIKEGNLGLTVLVSGESEIAMALNLTERGVVYPLSCYPQIREFAAMLDQLAPGKIWDGANFHASSDAATGGSAQFQFRRHADGVLLSFSEAEWNDLKKLFSAAMDDAWLQSVIAELGLIYGEL